MFDDKIGQLFEHLITVFVFLSVNMTMLLCYLFRLLRSVSLLSCLNNTTF